MNKGEFSVLIVALVLSFCLGLWAGDKIKLQQEEMVRATVREMVKPEVLKDQPF